MVAEWPPSAYTEGSFVTGIFCDLPYPGRMAPFRYDFADRIYCSHSVYSAMLAEWSLLTAADGMPMAPSRKERPFRHSARVSIGIPFSFCSLPYSARMNGRARINHLSSVSSGAAYDHFA